MTCEVLREIFWRPAEGGAARPLVAGSGLLKAADDLWAVGDDLHHLIHIPDEGEAIGYRMLKGDLPEDFKARKKIKPDHEALFKLTDEEWIAMPSGSKLHRARGVRIRARDRRFELLDFSPLFARLRSQIEVLNLEGAAMLGEDLVLLQRGNGKGRINALVFLRLADVDWEGSQVDYHGEIRVDRVPLGDWDKVPFSFTDGFTHEGKLYFSAAAEDTEDVVEDGLVLGSMIGVWQDGTYRELGRQADVKWEGLALESVSSGRMTCFAINDADEKLEPSKLYKLVLDIGPA